MAQFRKKENSLVDDATIVATLAGDVEKQDTNNSMQLMAKLLAAKLQRESGEEEERLRVAREAQKAGALAMQTKRDSELRFQNSCPHTKPWGGPSIGGQKDHQGNYHFICLYCSKQWLNDQLPPNLKISMDRIGGPE